MTKRNSLLETLFCLDLIPGLASTFPVDPLACMINALLVYYMLYQKRVFTMTQLASSASTYLISTVLTTLVLLSCYNWVDSFFTRYLGQFSQYHTLITAVIFSILTILVSRRSPRSPRFPTSPILPRSPRSPNMRSSQKSSSASRRDSRERS